MSARELTLMILYSTEITPYHLICMGALDRFSKSFSEAIWDCVGACSLIARLMGPTWGPSGADRTQVGPLLAPWTLLSGFGCWQNRFASFASRDFASLVQQLCQDSLNFPHRCQTYCGEVFQRMKFSLIIFANFKCLTHWGRVTQICISKLTNIGWDNGLLPDRR